MTTDNILVTHLIQDVDKFEYYNFKEFHTSKDIIDGATICGRHCVVALTKLLYHQVV